MKMKKVLFMMAFVMPVMIMAQTKTAPQKKPPKPVQERGSKVSFEYIEMIVTEVAVEKVVESPKKSKKSKKQVSTSKSDKIYKITFNFGKRAKQFSTGIEKASSMKNPMEALSYLGSIGWELIAVSGGSYYLKKRVR